MNTRKTLTRHDIRRLETRQALMSAAEKIVLTRGASALTADALAEEANISRRSIFNHFSSIHDAVYARMGQYLIQLSGGFSPRPSKAQTGFESDLLEEARLIFTLENIEKYMKPAIMLGLKMQESGVDPSTWATELTADLSRQAWESTRLAFPNAHPIHLKVVISLFVDIIDGATELWCEEYLQAQQEAQESAQVPHSMQSGQVPSLPTMNDLHGIIHEGFDFVQHFIDNAPALEIKD